MKVNQPNAAEVLRSQRKVLALLLLYCMLFSRLGHSSRGYEENVTKAFVWLADSLISERLNEGYHPIDNNLNILALLQTLNVLRMAMDKPKHFKSLQGFISLILGEAAEKLKPIPGSVTPVEAESASKLACRQAYLSGKLASFIKPQGRCDCQFLVKSAHQFMLSDPTLIPSIIYSISFSVLRSLTPMPLAIDYLETHT